MRKFIGERFGRLVVTKELPRRAYPSGRTHRMFECVCDCGSTNVVTYTASYSNLRSGAITHCGCASKRHGGYGTRLYSIWRGMVQRCTIPSYAQYKRYGERGISVCADWLDFSVFRAWAETNGYAETLTLERKDNNGNYEPQNCTWIPKAAQAKNTRMTVKILHDGIEYTATDLAKKLGVNYTTLLYRLRHNKLLEQQHHGSEKRQDQLEA